jgi:hypothetical protein
MLLAMLRVLIGFLLACLVAGTVQVAFALGPSFVSTLTNPEGRALEWILLTATHSAVFAAPFALIAASIAEWQSFRSIFIHAAWAVAIALAGFAAQYQSELPGQPATIANTYALATYGTTGLLAGIAYWLASGRFAGEPPPANKTAEKTASEPAT